MTDKNDKYRALFLSALMVLSVMVGTVALAGSAAAATGSVSLDKDFYDSGETVTVSVSDGDLNDQSGVSETYVVNIESTSEGQTSVTGEAVSTTTHTTANVVADRNGDNKINVSDITYTDGTSGATISSVSRNTDGTADVTFSTTPDGSIDYTSGETIQVSETGADTGTFTGTTTVSTTNALGTLLVADGDTVTVTYQDVSASTARTDTATIDTDPGAPKLLGLIEDGGDIELAFSEGVNGGDTTDLDASDITVYRNGQDVTSSVTGFGSSSTGRAVLTGLSDVLPNESVTVNIATVNDTAERPVASGNYSVQISASTIVAGDGTDPPATNTISVYQGSAVAVDFSSYTTNTAFERYADDRNQFSGSTGINSFYVVFDTAGKNLSAVHEFRVDTDGSGTFDADEDVAEITLRDLGLGASADSTTVTDREDLTVSVTSNAGGRTMEATLYSASDDSVVASQVFDTDSSTGGATVNFGTQDTGTYYVVVQDVLSGASATTADITVEDAGDVSAGFVQNTYTTRTGDIAAIAVSLQNTNTASLTLGSEDAGYEVNLSLTDGDGDGVVTVEWNTYQAGLGGSLSSGEFRAADTDDKVTPESSPSPYPSNPVDTGTYNLDVRAGSSFSAAAQAVSVVAVEDRFTNGVSSWTVPEERPLSDLSEIQTAADNGNLTEDDTLAIGDWMVLAVDANGLEGVLAAQTGATPTDRFIAGNGSVWSLRISQTNPRQNRGPKTMQLSSSSLTVVPDADNETYYLVIDTSAVSLTQDGSTVSLASGDKYRVNFTVLKNAGFQAQQQVVTDSVGFTSASISIDRDPVQVLPETGQSVTGTSTLAPGSTVRIQLQSVNASPRFIKSTSVQVQPDGSWSASFDFQNQAVGDTFGVTVTDGSGARLASQVTAEGEVVSEIEEPGDGVRTVIVPSPTPAFVPVTRVVTQEVTRTVIQDRTVTVTVTQTPGQPGFGIAVAIVALLAAALLALRRRD